MAMYDEDNVKLVKELKLGVGDTLTKYEDILTHLEAIYSVKPEKYTAQLKEMKDNFRLIEQGPGGHQSHRGGKEQEGSKKPWGGQDTNRF